MNLKHLLWMKLGSFDFGLNLIDFYVRWKNKDIEITTSTTEIVIEGYPRSANTRMVAAIRLTCGRNVRIAHHVHGSAQILRGVRLSIPTVVLIRNPLAATVSLIVRDKNIAIRQALRDYVNFYKPILPIKDKIMVVGFEEIVNEIDSVIENILNRFNIKFTRLERLHVDEKMLRNMINEMDIADSGMARVSETGVSLPCEARKRDAERISSIISENREFKNLLCAAEKTYRQVVQ